MTKKVPKRIATTIINSLRGGVVPRNGTGYITKNKSSGWHDHTTGICGYKNSGLDKGECL